MRKSIVACLIVCSILLSSCQSDSAGVMQADSVAHFFEVTETPAADKAQEEEALAKAVITATKHASYPTPYATYLVGSNLTTYAAPGSVTNTPTATPVTPSATPTKTTVAPTSATSAATTAVAATATRTPTTAVATATAASTTVAATATATTQSFAFAIQSGTPVQIQNFANSSGCSWQGIAGQVFDLDGAPLKNVVVKAGGTWNGASVSVLAMTGLSTGYGEGGYELVLGTSAVNSANTVWVQLYDLAGNSLSQKVNISTSSDCTKNLVLLNFRQIDDEYTYVPLVVATTAP
jgi:hypothetical protein